MKRYNIAVVGVGAVGVEMLRVLRQRDFPISELKVFARKERQIEVDGITYNANQIHPDGFKDVDIALFAGTEGEKGAAVNFAPEAIKRGTVVIDNGADFRLKRDIPLVIPEVNPQDIKKHKGLIANPNCSTIQMVLTIFPIYKKVGIKRIIVCTYQAASGAGRKALEQLRAELKECSKSEYQNIRISEYKERVLPQQLAFNVFPQIGDFGDSDYTSEEWKCIKETHKILHNNKIKITSTCVRVPVRTGHSEAIYLETRKRISIEDLREILSKQKGLKLIDEPKNNFYPKPLDCEGKDEVLVGRIRKDPFVRNGVWLWCVSDNLRKGAALNAVQIAEELIKERC